MFARWVRGDGIWKPGAHCHIVHTREWLWICTSPLHLANVWYKRLDEGRQEHARSARGEASRHFVGTSVVETAPETLMVVLWKQGGNCCLRRGNLNHLQKAHVWTYIGGSSAYFEVSSSNGENGRQNLLQREEKLAEAWVVLCCFLTYKEQNNAAVGKDQSYLLGILSNLPPQKNISMNSISWCCQSCLESWVSLVTGGGFTRSAAQSLFEIPYNFTDQVHITSSHLIVFKVFRREIS